MSRAVCGAGVQYVLRKELRRLGWIEGTNLAVERRAAEGEYDRLPNLAAELVALKPDVIVGPSSTVARAVKDATSDIPIVFSFVGDPVGSGLVQSLAHPGSNLTGVTGIVTGEYLAKNFEILQELLPTAKRMAALGNASNETSRRRLSVEVPIASQHLGLPIDVIEVSSSEEVPAAIAKVKQLGADGLVVVSEAMLSTPPNRIPDLVANAKLPTIYQAPEMVQAGGLIAYSWDTAGVVRRHAQLVDRVLRGANPAETPVEQPTKYNLVINLKTATALGLVVPAMLLARADEVIE